LAEWGPLPWALLAVVLLLLVVVHADGIERAGFKDWGSNEAGAIASLLAAVFTGAAFWTGLRQLRGQQRALDESIKAQATQARLMSRQLELMAADLDPMFIMTTVTVTMETYAGGQGGQRFGVLYLKFAIVNNGGNAYHVKLHLQGASAAHPFDRYSVDTIDHIPSNFGSEPLEVMRYVHIPSLDEGAAGSEMLPLHRMGQEIAFEFTTSRNVRRQHVYGLRYNGRGPPVRVAHLGLLEVAPPAP
jgi:hypothetical protein